MRDVITAVALISYLAVASAPAHAGKSEGAALVAHAAAPSRSVSCTTPGTSILHCAEADPASPAEDGHAATIAVYTAAESLGSVSAAGVDFGIEYSNPDANSWTSCGHLEIPTSGQLFLAWPRRGSGNSIVWATAASDEVVLLGSADFGGRAGADHRSGGGPDYSVGEDDTRFVWALHIEDSMAQVPVNHFLDPNYRRTFPVRSVSIRAKQSFTDRSTGIWGQFLTLSLPVGADGTVPGPRLNLPPRWAARPDSMSGGMLLSREEADRLRALQVEPSLLLGWDASPESTLIMLRTTEKTVVVARSSASPVIYPWPTVTPAFAGDGRSVATATRDGRLVVFDWRGLITYERGPSGSHFGQLHLDYHGNTLAYVREASRSRAESGAIDLRTGMMQALPEIPDGPRYYSADGARMLLLTQVSPGQASFYNTSDQMSPQLVARYRTEAGILTASVCDDGSLVATEEDTTGIGSSFSIVLLNGSLHAIGQPLVSAVSAAGLEFEGKFLFVGFQRHPFPAFLRAIETRDILLFDLGH